MEYATDTCTSENEQYFKKNISNTSGSYSLEAANCSGNTSFGRMRNKAPACKVLNEQVWFVTTPINHRVTRPPPHPLHAAPPVSTIRWTNAVLMLAQLLWCWDNIKTTLVYCLEFAGLGGSFENHTAIIAANYVWSIPNDTQSNLLAPLSSDPWTSEARRYKISIYCR